MYISTDWIVTLFIFSNSTTDDPGKITSNPKSQEEVHKKNFDVITECINIVCETLPKNERSIAIKLTAFMPISFLVKIREIT